MFLQIRGIQLAARPHIPNRIAFNETGAPQSIKYFLIGCIFPLQHLPDNIADHRILR